MNEEAIAKVEAMGRAFREHIESLGAGQNQSLGYSRELWLAIMKIDLATALVIKHLKS